MTITLFIPCFVDLMYPEVGISMVRIFEKLGHQVVCPEGPACCGQPAFNTGYWDESRAVAGKVIEAFGHFLVGGNFAVGIMVFLILVVINFVVITKGAGRVAEVSARFTLDAMPGKQMAIDADLNAGLIGEDEARKRRILWAVNGVPLAREGI